MKNDDQENGVLTGPLILIVPASNLVAIMSLNWLDGTNRGAVSAQTHGRTIRQLGRELRKTSASRVTQASRFRGRAIEMNAESWMS
jgi:hypothetical protein